jgi:hypothetical protein
MKAGDAPLLRYVQREIRSGKKNISVPAELLLGTSKEGVAEARNLCKLSGARIVNVDAH